MSGKMQDILIDIWDEANHRIRSSATVTGGGDASAANQTAVQADAGSDASKAIAVQGITSGKAIPVSQVDGQPVALGATTVAAASSVDAEDTTARTGIGLFKGIKNILILLNAKFAALGQAAMAGSVPVAIANNQSAVPTKDAGPNWTATHKVVHGDMSLATSVTDAPTAGQKLVLTEFIISASAAAEVTLKEETSGTVMHGPFFMAANGTIQITTRSRESKLATADKNYQAISTTADHITVETWCYSEA